MEHHSIKHGLVRGYKQHPLYGLYYSIRTRCYNASKHNYPYYQGKGIKMCDEWLNSLDSFVNWCKNNGWEQGLTIDRIDSDKDYCPSNCRFITREENSSKSCVLNGNASPKNYKRILKDEDVIEIKKLIAKKVKGTEIARMFNVYKSIVYKIKNGKNYKDIVIAL